MLRPILFEKGSPKKEQWYYPPYLCVLLFLLVLLFVVCFFDFLLLLLLLLVVVVVVVAAFFSWFRRPVRSFHRFHAGSLRWTLWCRSWTYPKSTFWYFAPETLRPKWPANGGDVLVVFKGFLVDFNGFKKYKAFPVGENDLMTCFLRMPCCDLKHGIDECQYWVRPYQLQRKGSTGEIYTPAIFPSNIETTIWVIQ